MGGFNIFKAMKINKIKSAIKYIIAAIAGIFFISYLISDTYTGLSVPETDFGVDTRFEITKVELYKPQQTTPILIQKSETGQWILKQGLGANESAVKDLLATLHRLTTRYPVSLTESPRIKEILKTSGTRAKIYIKANRFRLGPFKFGEYNRLYRHLFVGNDTPKGNGTYMMKSGAHNAFVVFRPGLESGISQIFLPQERIWRNPVIINLNAMSIRTVIVNVPGNTAESYQLIHQGDGQFTMNHYNGEKVDDNHIIDSGRVVRFLSSFTDIYYETLLDDEGENIRKILIEGQPFMEITVETIDENKITLVCWARQLPEDAREPTTGLKRDPNRFYIQVNQSDFALAQYYVFNRILRPFSFFVN